jgi:hypothetical protein
MSIREAFFTQCEKAKPGNSHFVSLYMIVPFYGGPEEGGWWGSDSKLIAYHQCSTDEEAEAVREKVLALADQLSKKAKRAYGEQCAREIAWLESRGLDDSFLPEVDGEIRYSVCTEETPGSMESRGCRHYE